MISPEVLSTLIGFGLVVLASIVTVFGRLVNKVNSIETKIAQLEKQGDEDRAERKEQTKVLHDLSLSIQKLSGFLEAHNGGLPLSIKKRKNVE